MKRLAASGMFFREDFEKFFLRGVSYGPFRPGDAGEPFPDRQGVRRDFELIRELGANTLRLYHVPPQWLRDCAGEFGLRLFVGIPWAQHIRFLDSKQTRGEIRRSVREAARSLRDAPNLLGLLVGNEISPQIARWYGPARIERFLAELADEVRQADPEALVSYASFPMTEFLDLCFADFACFNVYLHREADLRRYLSRLQNISDFRPVVISEFGVDSLREGEDAQADIVEHTAAAAFELGCAGVVVFSFTDEWFTGGYEIGDWCFGLVSRDRQPKPAYRSLQRVYHSTIPNPPDSAPSASVVICAYNAEPTLGECLESLRSLRYPDFEVIVVDDGSTDGTRAIAERYPEFQLISQENRGLSAARNVGIAAARGDVVAFTDADCAVDPDWLTFLVERLCSEDFAGVGGPNLPPPEDNWVSEVVARSPGGPTHVLLSDSDAEHVPGCNMAFWRKHLVDVGVFDPIFRTAGDDVDICWRLQNEGYRIGYSPVALVWHRRRSTVRDYLKQQMGYGRAESQLRFKHTHRFNDLGQSRWSGRIYGGARGSVGRGASVIYAGPFGSGLFQTLYEPPGSLWRSLPATLEWNATAAAFLAVGAVSYAVGTSLSALLLAGLVLFGISLANAAETAHSVNVTGLPVWRVRALVALLSYLGPLVRGFERNRHRYRSFSRAESPRLGQRARVDWLGRNPCLSYWNETGLEKQECIEAVLELLREREIPVLVDDGWQPWDVCIGQVWVRGQIKVLVENHGGKKRQLNVGMSAHPTRAARLLRAAYVSILVMGGLGGSAASIGTALAAALAVEGFLVHQTARLAQTFREAIEICARSLPVMPLGSTPRDGVPTEAPPSVSL